jgi:hypothetical protein
LALVFYGCETWFLILREEHKLRVFKSSVLRKIFGSRRDEIIGCRKLHNKELCKLRMGYAGHVAYMGEK